MKKKIVIIGAGFSGISAARRLSGHGREIEVKVIDKSSHSNFLPLLPDALGRGVAPELLEWDLKGLSAYGVDFANEEALGIDEQKKEVHTSAGVLNYDYLIVACGSETNFYGNRVIERSSLKLDNASDARRIISSLARDDFGTCVIAGAGYTGAELASNLGVYFNKRGLRKRVLIVERAADILGPVPSWMRSYISDNFKKQGIEVLTGVFIEEAWEGGMRLSSGRVIDKSLLIWAAGVKIPDFLAGINAERNRQGRIKVDEYLRLNGSCFVLGDAAYFKHGEDFLRMAVQFAITQGEAAAANILSSIKGAPLKKYRPRDLGFIIPMANNRSCGEVLGLKVTGWPATSLHYLMCGYRLPGMENKSAMWASLIKGGGRC